MGELSRKKGCLPRRLYRGAADAVSSADPNPSACRQGGRRAMPAILGLSAFYHDSAAALVVDGNAVAAAQEERFTRRKHAAAFPARAVRYCLGEAGLRPDQLDAV